jgi:hypothetical protein
VPAYETYRRTASTFPSTVLFLAPSPYRVGYLERMVREQVQVSEHPYRVGLIDDFLTLL